MAPSGEGMAGRAFSKKIIKLTLSLFITKLDKTGKFKYNAQYEREENNLASTK